MTNATKAGVIAVLNAGLGLAVAFGVPLTETQIGAIMMFANSAGGLAVLLTYKASSKRLPEGTEVAETGGVKFLRDAR